MFVGRGEMATLNWRSRNKIQDVITLLGQGPVLMYIYIYNLCMVNLDRRSIVNDGGPDVSGGNITICF